MIFLNREENNNFYQRNGMLYNINKEKAIDDVSVGYFAEEFGGGLICPMCEIAQYETGCRVTHIENGAKEIFFFNNDGKCIANTKCSNNQNRNMISITPTNLGVFVSEFSYHNMPLYIFKKYDGSLVMKSSILDNLVKYIESIVEKKETDIMAISDTYDTFKSVIQNQNNSEKDL